MQRVASDHSDEGEEEESNHQQYFEDGHVKLRDAKVPHGDRVQESVENDHRDYDSLDRHFVGPKCDHYVHGHDLERHQDRHIEEKVPCESESKGIVYPCAAEADEGRWYWEVRYHLSEAFVNSPHHACPDDKRDEEACGTTFR